VEPPAVLQLAGHPLRWRLLAELGRSDRRVGELTRLVDQPQNLVSYHLAKLRDAELVAGRRSSADGRDTYYRLDHRRLRALLAQAGGALHPALALRPVAPPRAAGGGRVLFLCTGNSARSPMAAAIAAARSGGAVEACSAGSHPRPRHRAGIELCRARYGVDVDPAPTHVDDLAGQRFDRVVTLCDKVREVCPELPGAAATAHWSIPEPDDDPDAFHRTADELEGRVDVLLAELAPTTDTEDPWTTMTS